MFKFYKSALMGVITNPLCEEYKNEWRRCNNEKDKLVKLAMRQQSLPYFITHCYQGKGLSKEYITKNFNEFINGKSEILNADLVEGYSYAMYVDFNDYCTPHEDVLAFMWCNSQVEMDMDICPILYIGAGSEIHLVCNGYNSPRIYLFDDSKLFIEDVDESCSITVNVYSKNATVEKGKYCICEKIKIFDKELRL